MKIAYLFVGLPTMVRGKLSKEILPLIEADRPGMDVVAMFFCGDNVYTLHASDPLGQRLLGVAAQRRFPVVVCETCARDRRLEVPRPEQDGAGNLLLAGVQLRRTPDPYLAQDHDRPDRVITV